jgi:hypothetical protein
MQLFREARYSEAIDKYTEAIALNKYNHVLYLNR